MALNISEANKRAKALLVDPGYPTDGAGPILFGGGGVRWRLSDDGFARLLELAERGRAVEEPS